MTALRLGLPPRTILNLIEQRMQFAVVIALLILGVLSVVRVLLA